MSSQESLPQGLKKTWRNGVHSDDDFAALKQTAEDLASKADDAGQLIRAFYDGGGDQSGVQGAINAAILISYLHHAFQQLAGQFAMSTKAQAQLNPSAGIVDRLHSDLAMIVFQHGLVAAPTWSNATSPSLI